MRFTKSTSSETSGLGELQSSFRNDNLLYAHNISCLTDIPFLDEDTLLQTISIYSMSIMAAKREHRDQREEVELVKEGDNTGTTKTR